MPLFLTDSNPFAQFSKPFKDLRSAFFPILNKISLKLNFNNENLAPFS